MTGFRGEEEVAFDARSAVYALKYSVATNEYRGGNGERTEYHACVAWERLAD